jgi:hypothetical protein
MFADIVSRSPEPGCTIPRGGPLDAAAWRGTLKRMTEPKPPPSRPARTPATEIEHAARRARAAAALRANLRKRKEQARARAEAAAPKGEG